MKNLIILLLLISLFVGCRPPFEVPNGYSVKSSKYIGNSKYEVRLISDGGQEEIRIYGKARTGEERSLLAPNRLGYHEDWGFGS